MQLYHYTTSTGNGHNNGGITMTLDEAIQLFAAERRRYNREADAADRYMMGHMNDRAAADRAATKHDAASASLARVRAEIEAAGHDIRDFAPDVAEREAWLATPIEA